MLSHQLLLASAAFAIPMLAARQAGLVSTIMVTVYDLPVGVQPSTEWGTPATPVASAVAAGATPSMVAGVQLANVAAAAQPLLQPRWCQLSTLLNSGMRIPMLLRTQPMAPPA